MMKKYKPMEGLKRLREAKHLSQKALADVTGIYQGYIYMYENGLRQPTLGTAIKLADVLECTVEELL